MLKIISIAVFALVVGGSSGAVVALEPTELVCDGPLFDGIVKYNEEISGVKCLANAPNASGHNTCYIVADEKKGLQQISVVQTGRESFACNLGPVIAKKRGLSCLKGKKPERDFEAIASDGQYLYITGSWGNRRKKHVNKSPERWVLLRQKLSGADRLDGQCKALKRKTLKSFVKNALPKLRPFIDVPLQCGGLNIEGLAVQDGKLFFGLRSPGKIADGVALVVETSAAGLFSSRPGARIHELEFRIAGKLQKGIGIRALESVGDGRILIATGTGGATMKNLSQTGFEQISARCMPGNQPLYFNQADALPSALWSWQPASGKIKFLGAVEGDYGGRKLEGLSVLTRQDKKLHLILAFDGVDNDQFSPLAIVSVDDD